MKYRKPLSVASAVVVTAVFVILIPISIMAAEYSGTLRVYVVEPESRWVDHDGHPYHFGFLDFAIVDDITVADPELWDTTVSWSATAAGFSGVTSDNVMVMATLFNLVGHEEDLYPGNGFWFWAYDVDASAAAVHGVSGRNVATTGFSHTVFAEEATAEWCINCPDVSAAIYDVYSNDGYPFYFVSLVDDMNTNAAQRLNQYWYQSQFPMPNMIFDGGYRTRIGDLGDLVGDYRSAIEACGARAVPPLDLIVSMNCQGGGNLDLAVKIGNGVSANSMPAVPATPTGPVLITPGSLQSFQTSSSDPYGDGIFYQFDWDDGEQSEWLGPYDSGVNGLAQHTWQSEGTFDIRARAKDTPGDSTGWSPLLSVNAQCCVSTLGDLNGINGVEGVDLGIMIDHLFISLKPWICLATADCNQSGAPNPSQMDIDGIDLSLLINTLFISLEPLPPCP